MVEDNEIAEIIARKTKEIQERNKKIIIAKKPSNNCTNCGGTVEPELLTELKPGANFCPKCVLMAAEAFVRSKSFMIEISANKKKSFARVREFDPATNSFGEQKIIDVLQMPIISIVGTIDFFKAVPRGIKKFGK